MNYRKCYLTKYEDVIIELLQSGCTYPEVTEELNLNYIGEEEKQATLESVSYYARTRGLQSLVTQGRKNDRINIPICSECEFYKPIKDRKGRDAHYCEKDMRILFKNYYAPMWCQLRDADRTKLKEIYGIGV